MKPSVDIIIADAFQGLAQIADNTIDCIVTSPPYWGLRDYGAEGQIGLEPTMSEHIETIVRALEECRRVLKPEGTCWLNYGDAYAGSWGAQSREHAGKHAPNVSAQRANQIKAAVKRTRTGSLDRTPGLKPKDLMMLPNRIAIALQDAGWWVRSEIIWHKPNPMPESTKDRPTQAHEKVFLLTKSARYFYDAAAIREPISPNTNARVSQNVLAQEGSRRANGGSRPDRPMKAMPGVSPKSADESDRFNRAKASFHAATIMPVCERNARNVWTVSTAPFSEAHFATFPPALAERCIKAGSPKGGHVLDPFGGAGTTGLVAARLGRAATLIEINPEYAAMARRRIDQDWMGPDERAAARTSQDASPLPLFSGGAA